MIILGMKWRSLHTVCLFLCLFLVCSLCKPRAAQWGGVSTAQRDFQFPDHQWLSYPKLVSEICFKQNQYQIQRLGDETSIYSGSKVKVFKNWNLVFGNQQRRETAVDHYPNCFKTNTWLSAWLAHLWNTPVEFLFFVQKCEYQNIFSQIAAFLFFSHKGFMKYFFLYKELDF